jgi:hypothetical protein
MVSFGDVFPDEAIVPTLSMELSWSHFVEIIPLKGNLQRDFYAERICFRPGDDTSAIFITSPSRRENSCHSSPPCKENSHFLSNRSPRGATDRDHGPEEHTVLSGSGPQKSPAIVSVNARHGLGQQHFEHPPVWQPDP